MSNHTHVEKLVNMPSWRPSNDLSFKCSHRKNTSISLWDNEVSHATHWKYIPAFFQHLSIYPHSLNISQYPSISLVNIPIFVVIHIILPWGYWPTPKKTGAMWTTQRLDVNIFTFYSIHFNTRKKKKHIFKYIYIYILWTEWSLFRMLSKVVSRAPSVCVFQRFNGCNGGAACFPWNGHLSQQCVGG